MGHGHDALMGGGAGELGELLAGFLADAEAGLAARADELEEARVVAFAGYDDLVKPAPPGAQGLFDRMEAIEDVHMDSVEGRARAERGAADPMRKNRMLVTIRSMAQLKSEYAAARSLSRGSFPG